MKTYYSLILTVLLTACDSSAVFTGGSSTANMPNIGAAISNNGTLTITGTNGPDDVVIRGNSAGFIVRVGTAKISIPGDEVEKLEVNTLGGNDTVLLGSLDIKYLDVATGAGDDYLRIEETSVNGQAKIQLADGSDYFSWDESRFEGNTSIDGGTEKGSPRTSDQHVEYNAVLRAIDTGEGIDRVFTGIDTNSMAPGIAFSGFETGVAQFGYLDRVDLSDEDFDGTVGGVRPYHYAEFRSTIRQGKLSDYYDTEEENPLKRANTNRIKAIENRSSELQTLIAQLSDLAINGVDGKQQSVLFIGPGIYVLNDVLLRSRVHLVFSSDAHIFTGPDQSQSGLRNPVFRTTKSGFNTEDMHDVSIRSQNKEKPFNVYVSGDYGSFIHLGDLENALISDFVFHDSLTSFNAIGGGSTDIEDDPENFRHYGRSTIPVAPRGVTIRDIEAISSHPGYGLIQINSGFNMLFHNLVSEGGVTARIELPNNDNTIANPDMVGVFDVVTDGLVCKDGYQAVIAVPKDIENGRLEIRNTHADTCATAVNFNFLYPNGAKDGFFEKGSRIDHVSIEVNGNSAQMVQRVLSKGVPQSVKNTVQSHEPLRKNRHTLWRRVHPLAYITTGLDNNGLTESEFMDLYPVLIGDGILSLDALQSELPHLQKRIGTWYELLQY